MSNDSDELKQKVVNTINQYRNEADAACVERMAQNRANFDTYHMKQDWSHKQVGQSQEFLAKQFLATEQLTSFIKQGLMDLGDEWYSLEYSDGVIAPRIKADTIKRIMSRQMQKASFYNHFEDALKHGLLGSLLILKVHGKMVSKPTYTTEKSYDRKGRVQTKLLKSKDQVWQLALDLVSTKDFRPDPTGRGLYLLEDIEMDLHSIKEQVYSRSNPDGIFDADAVDKMAGDTIDTTKQADEARESGQNVTQSGYRKRTIVTECWGTILDEKGEIMFDNTVAAVANRTHLIRSPDKNPFWHNQHPYIITPIVRVPKSVWHIALMDAPTKHNRALNEIYNLILDAGLMSVFGIRQLRVDWLEDISQVDEGIAAGTTLKVGANCPPGQHALERVDTASLTNEALNTYNLTNSEFQQSALTNDLRLGALPSRAVKATEVVESSQSITGMLNGVAKSIEDGALVPLLDKCWMTIAQHIDDLEQQELRKLIGETEYAVIKQMSGEDIFANTVGGMVFKAFGITNTMNKSKDFRRITSLLQTVAGSEVLVEAYSKKYSFDKLLDEIMRTLDINTDKLKLDAEDTIAVNGGQQGGQQLPTPGSSPNMQSQIADVASNESGYSQGNGPIQAITPPPSPISGNYK